MTARLASSGIIADPSFSKLVDVISSKTKQPAGDILTASQLLVEGHTVPFISRYRRETIGALTPTDLFDLDHRLDKFATMVKSRDAKLKKLAEDGKLTDRLRKSFMMCITSDQLDELWAPFKEKHATNSAKAQSIPGLVELAEYLVEGMMSKDKSAQGPSQILFDKLGAIKIPTELQASIPSISMGVQFIATDMIAHDPENRKLARECYSRQFSLQSNIVLPKEVPVGSQLSLKDYKERVVKASNYRDYHAYSRLLHHVPNHQLLAIRRGSGQGSSSSGDGKKASSSHKATHSSSDSNTGVNSSNITTLTTKVTVTDFGAEKLERRMRSKYQLPNPNQQQQQPPDSHSGSSKDTDSRITKGQGQGQGQHQMSTTLDSVYEGLLRRKAKGDTKAPDVLVPWHVRNALITNCVTDAIKKSITPSLTKEAYKDALKMADAGAVEVFAGNLHRLLLTPPLASYFDTRDANNICVVDPGFAHGHKCVIFSLTSNGCNSSVASSNGTATDSIGGTSSTSIKEMWKLVVRKGTHEKEDIVRASAELTRMCHKHKVRLVVVGDGVGSHQAVSIVRQSVNVLTSNNSDSSSSSSSSAAETAGAVNDRKRKSDAMPAEAASSAPSYPALYTIVSECGASVYSASDVARLEYPGIDISFLGCMSIGARLVDPLSELVKIPPESLGIGMYQHDIAPKTLQHKLKEVVEICVNDVGVDLNTANIHILKYISGIDETKARNIVAHRDTLQTSSSRCSGSGKNSSGFQSLEQLKDVKGIGAITFKNAAGFLRVYDGQERLDSTCIHPEQYKTARSLLGLLSEAAVVSESASVDVDNSAGKKKEKKRTAAIKFTSSDIGSSVALHRTIAKTVQALAAPVPDAKQQDMCARAAEWMKKLGLSRTALDDLLDWLSLRSSGTTSTKENNSINKPDVSSHSDCVPAKKAKLNETTELANSCASTTTAVVTPPPVSHTDDIRLVRGVPPELIKISAEDELSSHTQNRKGGSCSTPGAGSAINNNSSHNSHNSSKSGNAPRALEVGMKITGKIKNIAPFGAFVDLGSGVGGEGRQRDGLLHISAFNKQHSKGQGLSFAAVTVGQQVEVTVVSIDNERGRVGLGLQ